MSKFRKNYSDEDIIEYAKEVESMAGLLRKLGLREVGGNYNTMRRKIASLDINTDHWTRQLWNKGKRLKDWKDYKNTTHLRKQLISVRGNRCEECRITEWNGKFLVLELDHVDGNRANNTENNLRLLCPNCHSQTPTWRNRTR